MRVKLLSGDPQKDPLIESTDIPQEWSEFFLSNCERMHFRTKNFEYLEQRFLSEDCIMSWMDINAHRNCTAHPMASIPMLALVFMLDRTVPCFLHGFGRILLQQGNMYLFYLPAEAVHEARLQKGRYQIMYCYISQSYLNNLAGEYPGIAELLSMLANGSESGLMEKAAPIKENALRQMWSVKQCNEGEGFRTANLKARCVDLVLEYIKESHGGNTVNKLVNRESISKNEKVFLAKKIIDEHDNGKITIAELAHKVGINEQHLKKIFKETFGMTVGKYQVEARFKRAKQMLLETDMYMVDIALKIGYQDESSLSRLFREKSNMTPQEFRMRGRNGGVDDFIV